MKKKRFYKNVERNTKWTEDEKGYPIDFSDKYLSDEGIYSDKYDYMRPKIKKKRRKKAKTRTVLKRLGITVLCFIIISAGYTFMDVYMQRHTMPKNYSYAQETSGGTINEVVLNLHALYTESVSLDGSVILDSVITKLSQGGYNSAAFDIKRADGFVGYKSSLASVDSYGATAFPASDLKTSVQKLNEQDILAVGRVYCYLDNLVPEQDNSAAVLNKDGVPYTDSKGNTYLNPDSETTYRYIKDIISEAMEMGVTVFVLDGINLPENISDNYNDGFEYISGKLYSDLGTDIKLLEAVDINFNSASADNAGNTGANDSQADTQLSNQIRNEISNQLTIDTGSDKIYYITSDYDKSLIKKNLEAGGISSYILAN